MNCVQNESKNSTNTESAESETNKKCEVNFNSPSSLLTGPQLSLKKCRLELHALTGTAFDNKNRDQHPSADATDAMAPFEIKNDEMKVDSNYSFTSKCSEDAVFAIDHIMELIFYKLDPGTLLNCRLVSHRWAFFGSKAMRKILFIQLWQPKPKFINPNPPNQHPHRSIEALISTLNTSTGEFPFNSFSMQDTDMTNTTVQTLLEDYGLLLKKLALFGNDTKEVENSNSIFVQDLKKLLTVWLPNLEHLILSDCIVLKEPPESKCEASSNFYSNLKTLQLKCEIPRSTFLEIVNCSPNLSRIELHQNNLDYFLQPVNRLNLLKTLNINVNRDCIDALENLASQSEPVLQNWSVLELNLNLFDLAHEPHLWQRGAEVLNKILTISSSLCEKLTWYQVEVRYLQSLIEIPKMPKIKFLTIKCYSRYKSSISRSRPTKILPVGVSLRGKFPNLQFLKIVIISDSVYSKITHIFDDFEIVPSVKKVTSNLLQNKNLRESFQQMFPNASLHHWDGGVDDHLFSCALF